MEREGAPAAAAVSLAGFYALYFGTVGILQPFLPAYLRGKGLSATQVGVVLALSPCVSLLGPPLWGHLADRGQRPGQVLTLLATGGAVTFACLLGVEGFLPLVCAMAAYGLFNSGVTPLADGLALQHVAARGGAYAHLRMFGSLGYIVTSVLFGWASAALWGGTVGRAAVVVPVLLLVALALWSLRLRVAGPPGPPGLHAAAAPPRPARRAAPLAGLQLLRERDMRLFLAATSLHWLACAPFHGMLSIHVTALGLSPAVVGTTAGVGVAAELAMMLAFPRIAGARAPRHLLALAFAASAVRWAGMALAVRPGVMVALSLLHAFSFGMFYLAAVGFMARRVPDAIRSSGQALFASATFGVGGLVGYALSGRLYDAIGGHRLFALAAALEGVSLLLILLARPAPAPADAPLLRPAVPGPGPASSPSDRGAGEG